MMIRKTDLEVSGAPVTYDGFAGEDCCGCGYTHLKNQQHHQEAGETQKHRLETAPPICQTWHRTTYLADVATYQLTLTSLVCWPQLCHPRECQGIQISISGGPDVSCQQRNATPATPTTTLITFHTRAYPTCNHGSYITCTWTSSGTTHPGDSICLPAQWCSFCEPPESERRTQQTKGQQKKTPGQGMCGLY